MVSTTIKYFTIIIIYVILMLNLLSSCSTKKNIAKSHNHDKLVSINNNGLTDKIIIYAKTLIGVPYLNAGNTPSGFDCSGYVHYVFANFKIVVPRVSKQFENYSKVIQLKNVKPCDIILFAGKDGNLNQINHIGIIVDNNYSNSTLHFIHASTSKGVMISELNNYFKPRLIKVVRVL